MNTKKGFALYSLCLASIALCSIAAYSMRIAAMSSAITALQCKKQAQWSYYVCVLAHHQQVVAENFEALRALSHKEKTEVAITAWQESRLRCIHPESTGASGWEGLYCISTMLGTGEFWWSAEKKGGCFVFGGYTFYAV